MVKRFFLGLIDRWFPRYPQSVRPGGGLIYRDVVKTEGEVIELSCGHRFLITHHKKGSYPCLTCAEAAVEKTQSDPAAEQGEAKP